MQMNKRKKIFFFEIVNNYVTRCLHIFMNTFIIYVCVCVNNCISRPYLKVIDRRSRGKNCI